MLSQVCLWEESSQHETLGHHPTEGRVSRVSVTFYSPGAVLSAAGRGWVQFCGVC